MPESTDYYIGNNVTEDGDGLLTTIKYNNAEVIQWLMQRHANFHLHKVCSSSTAVTFQGIQGCNQEHGIERATHTEVYNQQMTALNILCTNPPRHVSTVYANRVCLLLLAPGADNV